MLLLLLLLLPLSSRPTLIRTLRRGSVFLSLHLDRTAYSQRTQGKTLENKGTFEAQIWDKFGGHTCVFRLDELLGKCSYPQGRREEKFLKLRNTLSETSVLQNSRGTQKKPGKGMTGQGILEEDILGELAY